MIATGHGWGLAVFPLGAAVVAIAFAAQLVVRFAARRRPHEGVWAVALVMYAAASFAMFLGVIGGWTVLEFRVYWLLGAVLNVPYLFAGEVYLLSRNRPVGHVVLAFLVVLSVVAAVPVFRAPVFAGELQRALPLGRRAFRHDGTPNVLAQAYAIPAYFLLLFGLAWSVWKMRSVPALRRRALGVGEIAAGASVVAIGSGIGAAFHIVPLFSVSLALGVAVMFAGFLQTSAPPRGQERAASGPARSDRPPKRRGGPEDSGPPASASIGEPI